MLQCPSCTNPAPDGSRFCSSCGAALRPEDGPPTETSIPGQAAASQRVGSETTPNTARMLRSDSFDDVRFVPGTMLAERYRVVGPIGRGGMGEVYRADDLKLGQTVALKFLPEGLEKDADRLGRFFNEVRTARQVTHPNVCRVYDTGELEGQHFISMEYVDGEDLASLLRRIGRLPHEKAVQIARQLCAGLAAAHEQGFLHRDLKPANVMLDGRGQVKITDFGLAGLAEGFKGAEVRVGTPSYMAPEQLAGKQVTLRSDLYSLGLVLYELFTGRQAYEARTPAELRSLQETAPTNPSSVVDGFDPAVERVILRCLEKEPLQRPSSALSVAAALPGGDPLAEALAAGETPSPEMVAAAGGEGGVKPWIAVTGLLASILGLFVALVAADAFDLHRLVSPAKPPEALAFDAREIIALAGHEGDPVDSAHGFRADTDYFDYVESRDVSPDRWVGLEDVRPTPLSFWYRQSPRHMVPTNLFAETTRVTLDDPPTVVSGMATVHLDGSGRLLGLAIVPPQLDESEGPWPEPDWAPLFQRAGLDFGMFEPARPQWNPLLASDSRAAWRGHYPEQPEVPIRVEVGSFHGKPAYFKIVAPWTKPQRMESETAGVGENVANAILVGVLFSLLIGGMLLARRNLRLGRGDRRGAFRIAAYLFVVEFLHWLVAGDHVPGFAEVGLLIHTVAWALFISGAVWVCYIALEPHVRRLWPDLIISWTRLLSGRYRDPLVGRSILAGGTCFFMVAVWVNLWVFVQQRLGMPKMRPDLSGLEALDSVRQAAGAFVGRLSADVFIPVGLLFLLLLLRVLLRRQWAAVAVFVGIFTTAVVLGNSELNPFIMGILGLGFWSFIAFAMIRFGLLAVVMWFAFSLMVNFPTTTDLSAWYAGRTVILFVFFIALACYGFWISLAGRPLFAKDLLEEPAQ